MSSDLPTDPRFVNLTGRRFGRLVLLSYAGKPDGKNAAWRCRCDCGTEKDFRASNIKAGKSTSCGCAHREQTTERQTRHGHSFRGGITGEYRAWLNMRCRCYLPSAAHYAEYGGRGIGVCDRWRHSFENFLADMGQKPPGLTLERRDNNGDYSPYNCLWASRREQARNKRNNRWLQWRGQNLIMADAALLAGLTAPQLRYRLEAGWSVERAMETPVGAR